MMDVGLVQRLIAAREEVGGPPVDGPSTDHTMMEDGMLQHVGAPCTRQTLPLRALWAAIPSYTISMTTFESAVDLSILLLMFHLPTRLLDLRR